jgi:hypothetical protein
MRKQFGVVINKQGGLSEKGGSIEYKMSNAMAQAILKSQKGPKKRPQEVLCNYVNSQMGLKGHCVKVLVEL